MAAFDVILYHNPQCGTSRQVLDYIRASGFEPHIIEYLKTPPSAEMLQHLATRAKQPLRAFIREKELAYQEHGLDNPALTDAEIADILHNNPVLINRPVVVTPVGVCLCRPAERVSELLPTMQ